MRLGLLFSQFLLVFILGFYLNKLKIYEKIMNYKMALFAVPLVVVFSFDFSGLFNYDNMLETFKALLYWNSRIIVLTSGLVLLVLLFLRKIKIPKNGFAKQIASRSAFIYLAEPLISFIILTYLFMEPDATLFVNGIAFYAYQIVRVIVLLILVPLGFMAFKKLYQKKGLSTNRFTSIRVPWVKHFNLIRRLYSQDMASQVKREREP
jgi:hypothetical protein